MRLATLFFIFALLCGPAIRAQDQTLVLPGDVLVVKLLSKWGPPISRAVVVTPEGKLKLPALRGMRSSEDVSVGGLGLDDATQKVQQSYPDWKAGVSVHVILERGTVDQLLRQ